jgi:hypothetical protein
MKIFYGKSAGRADVPADAPIPASLETALAVFRDLEPRGGFMGIELDDRFVLMLKPKKRSACEIELLDTSIPAFDLGTSDLSIAEALIRAAAEGRDVFQIARAEIQDWEHWDLSRSTVSSGPTAASASSPDIEVAGAGRDLEFAATEAGFENGLAGASNAKLASAYHYILFGKQVDPQHPENSGVYFEHDSQLQGSVNAVTRVVLGDDAVHFRLRGEISIAVRRGGDEQDWRQFVAGVREVFGELAVETP